MRRCLTAGLGFMLLAGAGVSHASAPDGEIAIGVFVPTRGAHAALGRAVLEGAEAAADELNARGGVDGRRVRIARASADEPWGSSTRELARLLYEEEVWGIVAGVDSRSAHVAEQAITRARGRALLVSPWASDATLAQVPIPWFFRTVPDDRRQAEALAREIFERRELRHVSVHIGPSADERRAGLAFVRAAPAGSVILQWVGPGAESGPQAARLDRSAAEALVLFLEPSAAADRLRALRDAGVRLPAFGTLQLAVSEFVERAGAVAEGVVVVAPPEVSAAAAGSGGRPGPGRDGTLTLPALYAHDAVICLARAIDRADFERDRLAGAMAQTCIEGLTGELCFTQRGERGGEVALARLAGSRRVRLNADSARGPRKGELE